MNITLRPSGGRGEYELAGRHGALQVHDLFGLAMHIEIIPGVTINARSQCVLKDGKPRIRLTQIARNAHPSALIAAAMMLPKSRRERGETHGAILVRWEEFVVQTVRIDAVVRSNGVLIRPVTVRLENADGARLDINFAERMMRVVRLWTAAAATENHLAEAVRAHAFAFTSPTSTQAQMVDAVPALRNALDEADGDLLPLLEAGFGISSLNSSDFVDLSAETKEAVLTEEIQISPTEARIERVRQWRLAVVRGSSASLFRRNVTKAYDSRCLFSGQRLPRTQSTATSGVDAAHILPWNRYDLDATANGLCLSKQNHWAFDEGVLRLTFDESESVYVVSIPDTFRLAAKVAKFDLEAFNSVVGPIPRKRLPPNQALWPSKLYLKELNRFLDDPAA